jgi:tetratricopeptide (TPR) repeat protein
MAELEADGARRALEAVLKSSGFARNERMSLFLRFLVERHLEGRDHELKESVIGTEVFGRKADYSPKSDPIVRTEARRLRERLAQYYESSGASDRVRIELPKGGYVPVLRDSVDEPATSAPEFRKARWRFGNWRLISLAGGSVTILLAVAGWVRFSPGAGPRRDANSPARDLYVRARGFEVLPSLSGVESSIDLFRQAIDKDPSFAPAYAGVAAGYAARSGFDGFDTAQRAQMIAQGWAAAQRAIRLAPRSADAHDALGMMQARDAQWEGAELSFRRAINLAPREPIWRNHFAMFLLLPLGRLEEGIRELRVAEEVDPRSPQTHNALSVAFRLADRSDEALFHCQKAAENDQQRSVCWAQNLLHEGKKEEAVRILEASWTGHLLEPGGHNLGIAYAKAGRREDAERVAAMLPRLASKAQIFAALGEKDRTLEVLDRLTPMGPARMGRDFLMSPNFAFLRGDPRLQILKKKVGLPE